LAAFLGSDQDLSTYLDEHVFADADIRIADPDPADVAGYATYLDRYRAGLAAEAAAVAAL
ncbi:MAG TPA: ATPase, partial [Protaetiibacter sp.]|nr:ATPase [Protaetiibacter sp.]